MAKSPVQVLETVSAAQSVMEQLHARIAVQRDALDVGDFVYIQTTIKRIQELFQSAADHEELLSQFLTRSRDRMAQSSPQIRPLD